MPPEPNPVTSEATRASDHDGASAKPTVPTAITA